MNEDKLICPHCGQEQHTHEPDDISSDMCLTECENCGKEFWYAVMVTRSYMPYPVEEGEREHERK